MGLKAYQLVEVNLMSAQDLEPVTKKKMRTYCKSWVHPNRKLMSCVDSKGSNNPTWNDKFVFRVKEDFLREDSSAVMIEIYNKSNHWFKDPLVGTVRLLLANLFPPNLPNPPLGMRFVALQVRRPSGRPQGILNIGVALLDGCLRSMPMYKGCSSAVGYRDLMLDLPPNLQQDYDDRAMPMLLRSRSERSIGFDIYSTNGSMIGAPTGNPLAKSSSILSISEPMDSFMITKGKGKASSVINGAELREKPKKGKASSVVSDSVLSKSSSFKQKAILKEEMMPVVVIGNGKPVGSIQLGKCRGGSILSTSEIGPSASQVAAAMMMGEGRYNESSVLDGWSLDESIEGLKSKLQRWRTELPPLYDHHGYSSVSSKSSAHSDSSSSLFSCFGNICGYECQCIIGHPPTPRRTARSSLATSSSPLL